jgi:ParB family chromosome partitioning protein
MNFVAPLTERKRGRPCLGRAAMSGAERSRRHRKLAKKRGRSARDEWFTPAPVIELAREVMGSIDLDPCSCAEANLIVGAARFYTLADDGLRQPWFGKIWMNPPFSQINDFVAKLLDELTAGRVTEAIMLTHNSTDAAWFQQAARRASAVCFPASRIRFVSPHGRAATSPPQGSAILYYGPHGGRFVEVFRA